jgi:putative two-component system response regulator
MLSNPQAATRPRVLAVDDTPANLTLLEAYLAEVHCEVVFAEDGAAALTAIRQGEADVVLLDVTMPVMDGFEVCREIRRDPALALLPIVMITALDQVQDRVRALEAGADDFMTKPVERHELVARVRSALKLKALYDSLERAEQVIFALANAVEAKDAYTESHTKRVAFAARSMGARLGLGEPACDALYRGGMVHDIGKIGIPDSVLLKPAALDAEEVLLMRQHPVIGERILRPLRSASGLLPIVRHHHERYDGTGYPDGLVGQAIPLPARIVAVCDAFDALISDRPYRKGLTASAAVEVLQRGRQTQWDPTLVELFISELSALNLTGYQLSARGARRPRQRARRGREVA